MAQKFRTGGNADGYTITAVRIKYGTVANSRSIKIASDTSTGCLGHNNMNVPGNCPGTTVVERTNVNVTAGLNTITFSPAATLTANTDYWLVTGFGGGSRPKVKLTDSNDQTGTTGWSIADDALDETYPPAGSWETITSSMVMEIVGYARDTRTPAVTVSRSTLSVPEGRSETYTVALAARPVADVVIDISQSMGDDDHLTLDTDPDEGGNQETLTFTPANFDTPQTVTVTATGDTTAVGSMDTFTHSATSADTRYDGSTITIPDVVATIVALAPNAAPTGKPRIVGAPSVGATLTADVSGIRDENGLTDPGWRYVWTTGERPNPPAGCEFKGDTVAHGPGATSYVVQPCDAGRALTLEVSFHDDAGYLETLEGDPVTVGSGGSGPGPGPGPGGGDDDDEDDDDGGGDGPCSRHVAPYWHGEAVLVLRSANGRSVEVETACGGVTSTSTEFGGLIVREASCKNADGAPLVGSLAVEGAAPGGWYYVRGDRNVAVAPLMCASRFEGRTVRAATVGGTTATRSGNGTFVSHHATRLIGIVPDLPAGGTGSLKAPYWRGWGGIVGRAANGEYVDVDYGCEVVPLRVRLPADPDTGIVSSLLRPANCKSEDGRLFTGDLKVTGMDDGGWYWLDGPNGGPPAVAPLVRSSLLDEDVRPVDPGNANVTIHRGRDGTLFEETKADLSGVVPHLED